MEKDEALNVARGNEMTSPVIYSIGVSAPITPTEPLPPLPQIPRGSLVIVEGRAPIWRYGMALHLLHGSPAAAIAFYDPRLGAVVVATHSREWAVGDVVDITLPQDKATKA
jgi:CRISPR-associated protein Csx3